MARIRSEHIATGYGVSRAAWVNTLHTDDGDAGKGNVSMCGTCDVGCCALPGCDAAVNLCIRTAYLVSRYSQAACY